MYFQSLAGVAIQPRLDNANTLGNTEVNFVDQTMLEGEAIAAFRASPLHRGTTKIVGRRLSLTLKLILWTRRCLRERLLQPFEQARFTAELPKSSFVVLT